MQINVKLWLSFVLCKKTHGYRREEILPNMEFKKQCLKLKN